ncbi:MAG: hypothetical protein QM726_14740 [Chitinophagaceae bacterium]
MRLILRVITQVCSSPKYTSYLSPIKKRTASATKQLPAAVSIRQWLRAERTTACTQLTLLLLVRNIHKAMLHNNNGADFISLPPFSVFLFHKTKQKVI